MPGEPRQSLRAFLELLEGRGELLRIKEEVDPRFQITALVMELERQRQHPALLFERLKGHALPLATNVNAGRDRLALAMGVEPARLIPEYGARVKQYLPPRVLEDAPFRRRTVRGESVDLFGLPILTHFNEDGGPYVTAGLVVARDPFSETVTCGFHRFHLKERTKMGVSLHSRRRMYEYHRRAEEQGTALQVAVANGIHPMISLGSLALLPYQVGQYDPIGGLFGEPVEVVPSPLYGLPVPAWSELVIEGEILAGVREPEGPFGEFTGYASTRSTQNVFIAKAISQREDAIYQDICPGLSWEHDLPLAIAREVEIGNALSRAFPNVRAVHVPIFGCGSFICFISMRKTAEGQAKQAIFTTLGVDHYLKLVVVVDEDVDVFDEAQVLWAISTRCQPDRGVFVVPETMGTLLDPSATDLATTAKMGIDATKPLSGFSSSLTIPERDLDWARALIRGLASR
ncbi:MAG: UbiD family decarboxylase [Deltaproteobacteria bacterium]|nr:UbiD family decarboxylase [Deltaproteobacteria bacterium]